jgi:hypothetical protein
MLAVDAVALSGESPLSDFPQFSAAPPVCQLQEYPTEAFGFQSCPAQNIEMQN